MSGHFVQLCSAISRQRFTADSFKDTVASKSGYIESGAVFEHNSLTYLRLADVLAYSDFVWLLNFAMSDCIEQEADFSSVAQKLV